MIEPRLIRISDASSVGEARRAAATLSRELGFDDLQAGRLAIVVVELAKNVWQHARGGELSLAVRDDPDGVEVIALDKGPGIGDLTRALGDGFSTAGTAGTGLGAVRRQSQHFDVWSAPGRGSVVVARVYIGSETPPAPTWACLNAPKTGEDISGDAAAVVTVGRTRVVLVADGLGHGPDAAAASRAAVGVLQRQPARALDDMLEVMHETLRPTRGAAVSLAIVDGERGTIQFAGVGNVSGFAITDGKSMGFVSSHGTVGANLRKPSLETRTVAPGALFLLASDGVRPKWQVEAYAGLWQRDPALVAGALYRDFNNARDDATLVAVRV